MKCPRCEDKIVCGSCSCTTDDEILDRLEYDPYTTSDYEFWREENPEALTEEPKWPSLPEQYRQAWEEDRKF
jgi:hypothetical protein